MLLHRSLFIERLWREAGPQGPRILFHGALSGIFEALAVVFINSAVSNLALEEGSLNFRYLGLFAVSMFLYIYGDRYVLSRALPVVGALIYDTQTRIVDKLRRSSLREYERIERTRIYSALSDNAELLVEATRYLADWISHIVMLLVSACYILSLSVEALLMVLLLDALGLTIFLMAQTSVAKELRKVRDLKSGFMTSVRHALDGFKELKINSAKSDDLFENHITRNSGQAKELKIATEIRSNYSFLSVRAFFLLLVACVVFILPQFRHLETQAITSIVAVVLFSIGPLAQILLGVPFLTKAELAMSSIQDLENELDRIDDMRETQEQSRLKGKRKDFSTIALSGGIFEYEEAPCLHGAQEERRRSFTLGPLDLTIRRGETLFIAGGNGSGKSTLLKLLAGLYYPSAGALHVDEVLVKAGNYTYYRDFFSVIFSDFHLFDRLYGLERIDEDALRRLLDRLDLSRRTAYREGRFTDIDLSTGQKKRLALAVCALEDKPVLLFDEVAADFDPEFRRFFYEVYLKELKERGKTIVAISHDDRYFHAADRLVKMEDGRFVELEPHRPGEPGECA